MYEFITQMVAAFMFVCGYQCFNYSLRYGKSEKWNTRLSEYHFNMSVGYGAMAIVFYLVLLILLGAMP